VSAGDVAQVLKLEHRIDALEERVRGIESDVDKLITIAANLVGIVDKLVRKPTQ
jgi:hypothetical protein